MCSGITLKRSKARFQSEKDNSCDDERILKVKNNVKLPLKEMAFGFY